MVKNIFYYKDREMLKKLYFFFNYLPYKCEEIETSNFINELFE